MSHLMRGMRRPSWRTGKALADALGLEHTKVMEAAHAARAAAHITSEDTHAAP